MRRSVSALITGIFCASLGLSQRPREHLQCTRELSAGRTGLLSTSMRSPTTMARPPMLK
jgi:hypothetical protein